MWLLSIGVFIIGYLLGSIPFGYLVGRAKGIDIRAYGSRNIGATNVLRVVGKPWGLTVFFADALKGFAAVQIALLIAARAGGGTRYPEFYAILAAAACVIGHSFPIWLGFRGGKGVATSAGAIFGIMPLAAVSIFLVWLLVFQTTRYVSVASIAAACALPVVVVVLIWLKLTHGVVLVYFSIVMTAIVVWQHRSNLSRLLRGSEPRFTRK
jgi:glycerol-3-phosphate acyltransferase PlsY